MEIVRFNCENRNQTVKSKEDSRRCVMKKCMLSGTNVRYCKAFQESLRYLDSIIIGHRIATPPTGFQLRCGDTVT